MITKKIDKKVTTRKKMIKIILEKHIETNTEFSSFPENIKKEAVEEQTEETQNYEDWLEYKGRGRNRDFANSCTFSKRRGGTPDDYLVQEKSFDLPASSNRQSSLTLAIRTRNRANALTIQSKKSYSFYELDEKKQTKTSSFWGR